MFTLPVPELVVHTLVKEWGRQKSTRRFVRFHSTGSFSMMRSVSHVADLDGLFTRFAPLATKLMLAGHRDSSINKLQFDIRAVSADKTRLLPLRKKKMSFILELMRDGGYAGSPSKGLLVVDVNRGRIENITTHPDQATSFDEFYKVATFLVNRGANYGTGEMYRLHELDDKGNLVRIR
jgi:hypothetical protein